MQKTVILLFAAAAGWWCGCTGGHNAARSPLNRPPATVSVPLPVDARPTVGGDSRFVPSVTAQDYTREQVRLAINHARRAAAMPELEMDQLLERAAQLHGDDMVARDFFSHRDPNGGTLADRVRVAGYPFREIAENIALGYRTADELVDGWMASDGHRANILNPVLRDIGIGLAAGRHEGRSVVYAVAVFGAR